HPQPPRGPRGAREEAQDGVRRRRHRARGHDRGPGRPAREGRGGALGDGLPREVARVRGRRDDRGLQARAPAATMPAMKSLVAAAVSLGALLAAHAAIADGAALAWKLEKGAPPLRYRYTTEQEATHKVGGGATGEPVKTKQRERIEYRLTVLDADPSTGAARVQCRYD